MPPDQRAHAGAGDEVDGDAKLLQDLENADMRNPAGPAAGEDETYLGAAGYPGKGGLFFFFDGLGKAGRDEEQEKKDDSREHGCRMTAVRDHVGLPRVGVESGACETGAYPC